MDQVRMAGYQPVEGFHDLKKGMLRKLRLFEVGALVFRACHVHVHIENEWCHFGDMLGETGCIHFGNMHTT
jgi:hypothetical protein